MLLALGVILPSLESLRALLASGVASLELLLLLRLCSSFRLVVDGGLGGTRGFGCKTGLGVVEGFKPFFGGGSGFCVILLRCRSECDFPPFVCGSSWLLEVSTGGGDNEYLGREAALLFLSVTLLRDFSRLPSRGGLVSDGEWVSDVLLGTKGESMWTSEFRASL